MSDEKKQSSKFVVCMQILPVFIILAACLYNLPFNKVIKIVGDEYGYWAGGSYFAGLDWSEITSINPYYGYGYGFFLALILKFTTSMIAAYRIALIFNALLVCAIYVIALKLAKVFLFEQMPWYMQSILSLAVAVYAATISYTQYTLSEVLLTFLYWFLLYLSYLLLQKYTFKRVLLFEIVLVYALSVHMRMIGVLLVGGIFIIYILWKNCTKPIQIMAFLGIFLILLILFYIIKNNYQNAWYTGANSTMLMTNEVSGQLGKIRSLLTATGIADFIVSMLGKVFYALSATFLLAGIAPAVAFQKICTRIVHRKNAEARKKKRISNQDIMLAFAVTSTVLMMAVGSLYMIDYSGRFDLLTYGRYFEFTLSPLIFFSLIYLYKATVKGKLNRFYFLIGGYVILTLLINYVQDYNLPTTHMFINDTGIAGIMLYLGYQKGRFLFLGLICVVVYFDIILFLSIIEEKKKKSCLYLVVTVALGSFWIYSALYNYKNACLNWVTIEQEAEIDMLSYIQEEQIEDQLYYYYMDDVLKADSMQFMLREHTVHCIDDVTDFITREKQGYILTPNSTQVETVLYGAGYRVVKESTILKLWKSY